MLIGLFIILLYLDYLNLIYNFNNASYIMRVDGHWCCCCLN